MSHASRRSSSAMEASSSLLNTSTVRSASTDLPHSQPTLSPGGAASFRSSPAGNRAKSVLAKMKRVVTIQEDFSEDPSSPLIQAGSFVKHDNYATHRDLRRDGTFRQSAIKRTMSKGRLKFNGGDDPSDLWSALKDPLYHNANDDILIVGDDMKEFLDKKKTMPPRLKLPDDVRMTDRDMMILLEGNMNTRLEALRKRELSRHEHIMEAHKIFNDAVHEITRQVAKNCTERGRLLAKIWVRHFDLVNVLATMVSDDSSKHTQAEDELKAELSRARENYLTMVQRMEDMVRAHNQREEDLLNEQELREDELCRQLKESKEDLLRAQASMRVTAKLPQDDQNTLDEARRLIEDLKKELKAAKLKANKAHLQLLDAQREIDRLKENHPQMRTSECQTDPVQFVEPEKQS